MGQYYTPIIKNDYTTGLKSFYSHDYGNGLKLMEHSWIGNHFVNAVVNSLEEGDRLIWLGDYGTFDDVKEHNPDSEMTIGDFDIYIKEENSRQNKAKYEIVSKTKQYVINISKKEYIDLREYVNWAPEDDSGYQIHPIPLLTAVGNGKGGGDYFAPYSEDAIGSWAGDQIYATDELNVPADYRNASKDYVFCERELSEEEEIKYYNEEEDQ